MVPEIDTELAILALIEVEGASLALFEGDGATEALSEAEREVDAETELESEEEAASDGDTVSVAVFEIGLETVWEAERLELIVAVAATLLEMELVQV